MNEELRKLYDAISPKYNVGDFDSFSAKMSTTDDRKRFYDAISQKMDIGDYESYEGRLAVKKKSGSQVDSSNGLATSGQPSVPSPEFEASNAAYAAEADKRLATQGQRRQESLASSNESYARLADDRAASGYAPYKTEDGWSDGIDRPDIPGTFREGLSGDWFYTDDNYETYVPTPDVIQNVGGYDNLREFFKTNHPEVLLANPETGRVENFGAKPVDLDLQKAVKQKTKELQSKPFEEWSEDDRLGWFVSNMQQLNAGKTRWTEDQKKAARAQQKGERDAALDENAGFVYQTLDKASAIIDGVGSGGARFLAGALGAPEFLWDWVHSTGFKPPGVFVTGTWKQTFGDDELLLKGRDYLMGAVDRNALYSSVRNNNKGIWESFKEGNIDDGVRMTANAIGESVPYMASMMFGNAGLMTTYLSTASGRYHEEQMNNPERDLGAMMLNSNLWALAEIVPERIGMGAMLEPYKRLAKQAGFEVASNALAKSFRRFAGRANVVTPHATEMSTEMATLILQNAIDGNPLTQGWEDTIIVSGAMSTATTGPGQIGNAVYDNRALNEVNKLSRSNAELEAILVDPELEPEIREVATEHYLENVEKINSYIEEQLDQKGRLSSAQKELVNDLEARKQRMSVLLNSDRVSDAVKEEVQADIDAINEEITDIVEQSDEKQAGVDTAAGQAAEGQSQSAEIERLEKEKQEEIEQKINYVAHNKKRETEGEYEWQREQAKEFNKDAKKGLEESLKVQEELLEEHIKKGDSNLIELREKNILYLKEQVRLYEEISAKYDEEIKELREAQSYNQASTSDQAETSPEASADTSTNTPASELTDAQLEGEYNRLENDRSDEGKRRWREVEREQEKREWESVVVAPQNEARTALNALKTKDRDGEGVYIERRDIRESEEVLDRYEDPSLLSDQDLLSDFREAMFGNPNSWYADGLKAKLAVQEGLNRGMLQSQFEDSYIREYVADGFTEREGRNILANVLSGIAMRNAPAATETSAVTPVMVSEQDSQPGQYFTRDIGGDQVVYRRNEDGSATILPESEAQNILSQQPEGTERQAVDAGQKIDVDESALPKSEIPTTERSASKTVVDVPVSEIQTDEASFQNRESLDESRVQDIVDNFNKAALDPIVLYDDNGKTVVLSGHHRLAAAQKMGMETIPSRFFEGTKQEAIDFARDSNTLSRGETSTERASRYRDMRSRGETEASIREKARVAHGSDATKIINLSHLSESGKALETINSFSESADVDTKNKVEAIGDWIGNVKSRHPDLSTRQENEMFDYLMDKYGTKKKSGSVTSRSQFFDVANALINRLKDKGSFNEDAVLNLNNAAGKTGIELEYDQVLSDAKDAVDTARKALDDARKRAVAEGVGSERMSELLSPLENNLRNALADEQAVRAQKGQLQEAVKAQTSIFDIIEENEQEIKNNATIEQEVLGAFEEDGGTDGKVNESRPEVESKKIDAKQSNTTSQPIKPRTPKALLKGVSDKLAGTGLATSVKTATSAEITQNLGVNGESVNGYIDGDGAIVINSEKSTLDTPIHEFAHAWEQKVEKDNPFLHARGMTLIKGDDGKVYVDHVKKTQPGLKGDALYKEALAQAIGDRGARLIDSKRGNSIKEWLNDVWDYIAGLTGISGMTADQVSNLTLNEFADAVAVDLLSGKPVSVAPNGDFVVDIQAEKKSDMNESEKRIADFMERMRNKNNIRFQGEIDPSANRLSQEDLIEFITVAGDLVRTGRVEDFAGFKSFANSIGITNNGDITAAWASAKNFVDNKNSTSGFKKAKIQTDLIRKSTEKMSDEEYVELGKRIVDEGLVNPNDLVAELLRDGRVLQAFEQAALTYAKTQLDNRINENRAKLRKDPTNVDLRVEADSLFSLLQDYDIAIAVSGEHWSRSGRLRQVEMDKDYNAVYTLQEMDKIGEVPADVRARIEELGRELQETKADLALRVSEIDALKEAHRQAGINSAASVKGRRGKMNTAARKDAVEVLDSLDLSSFGVSAMRFQTNGGLRFSISPDPALQASLQGAVAKMKEDIASGKVRLEDAIESAINTVNSEVGEGNWNPVAFRSSVVNSFADKGNTVKPRKPYVGKDGKPVVPSGYLNDIVSAHRSANGKDMTIDEMVKSAKSELGKSFSDRDIRDSISGYGNATTNRMSDDRKNISTAKTIGRLQSRLEELENLGYSTVSKQPRAKQVNQEIEDLRKTINDMIDSLHDSDDYKSQMRSARDNKKKYIQEYIKDVEERITAYQEANRRGEKIPDGYFSKKPKYDFTSDPEIIELERKREDMRNKLKEEVYRHRIRNRSVTDVMLDATEQVLFNTTRMLTAGADLSAVLVQGGFITLSDPVSSVKALKLSVEKAGNKDLYDQYFHDLQRKPLFESARASKLNMQLPEFYQSIQEEQFGSQNIITKAYEYIIDKAFGENKKGAKKWKDGFPYSAAERQYGMFLTEIRFNLFEKSVNDAVNYLGIDINSDAGKDAMGRIAESINDMTMASNIRLIEGSPRAKKLVSMVMFSARKFAASWKLMYKVPHYGINFAINKGTSLVGGKTAAGIKAQTDFDAFLFQKLYGRYAGTAMGMAAATTIIPTLIANGLYDPDEEEEPPMMYNPNVLNPSHSDFMKLRWGNTRIDMTIGLGGNTVFLTRLLGSGYMTSSDPTFKRYDENVAGFRNKSRGEVAAQYFVNKLAPTPSIAYNHWFGNEYQRAETGDRIAESLYPMWLGGTIDQYNDTNSIGNTMAFLGLGMLGLANNTYGGVEFSDHRGTNNAEAKRIFERLLISDSTPERRTKVMYSPSSGVTKLQNSDFKQEYRDSYNEYMTGLTLAMKPLLLEKGLRPETVESMVNNMKSKAYKYAEVKATGVFVDEKFREVSDKKGQKFKLSNPQIKEKAAIIAQIMSSEKVQGMKPQLTKGYGKIYKSKGYLENKQLLDMDVYLELYDVAESMADIKMVDMIEKGKISPIPIKDYDKRTDNDGGYE